MAVTQKFPTAGNGDLRDTAVDNEEAVHALRILLVRIHRLVIYLLQI